MEIKQKAGASSARRGDDADGGGEGSSSSFQVSCGSQLDALDFCFADSRPDEAKQTQPWVLVVLVSTGKSLCLQVKCDQVESSRILLQREVLRMFSAPIPLSSQSPHVSTVGSRLMYVSVDNDFRQVLQLSEDDLNMPSVAIGATGSWKADANEVVVDVTWNKSVAAASADSGDYELLAAVRTTKRLVVLNKSLSHVRAYDLTRDLLEPQSMLWMVQTLFFVTKDNQLRYLTPLRMDLESSQLKSPHSRLACCLGEPADRSSVQHTNLLSICGDRLSYSVTDLRTLEVKAFLRPISICEPLLAGFVAPNGKLKSILERGVLVFAVSRGIESACPLTDYLLHILYYEFGWNDTTLRLIDALTNQPGGAGGSGAAAAASAMGGSSSSSYPKSSHLSSQLLASLYLHSHKWKEFLKVFLTADHGLEEYALADEDSGGAASSAKLPSRTGQIAQRSRKFGKIMDAIGQSELALKHFDLAGDDLSILEMTKKAGGPPATSSMLASLQKDWAKMNPPLSSIVNAETSPGSATSAQQLDSVIWRRHELFSLLCCDVLQQNERRSRLLTSVKPFDKMTLQASSTKKEEDGVSRSLDRPSGPRASILHWKRLVPEDAKDWIGVSSTPHFSSAEPKNPNYGLSSSSKPLLLSGAASGMAVLSGGVSEATDAASSALSSSKDAAASAKMTIGPFVDEEDAVVAYWRFEEGATLTTSDGNSAGGDSEKTGPAGVESLDTSKRENNLHLLGFGSATKLVSSSAPVDKGEERRIQEEFALRFAASTDLNDDEQERETKSEEWGARCIIRSGSTLDVGFVFDEDPYRRKLTFEAWLRNFVLAQKQQQQQQEQQEDDDFGSSSQFADPGTRMIVCRKSKDDNGGSGDLWWGFSLVGGYLALEFAGQSIKSDEKVSNAASWHHVAFSIDILSHKQASVKLFLQGRCVGTKEISSVDANAKLYRNLLKEYEMTEVRVWAAARTQDQLSDMKENYLGIAEAKKRMKIAIHQRNCQCEKCHSRRTKAPVAKLTMATPFPTTPPSATVRDRRRPQPKQ